MTALDQLANTILFGRPDETFSARTRRKRPRLASGFWALRRVINLAFRWESKDHCREDCENEKNRVQSPKEYSNK